MKIPITYKETSPEPVTVYLDGVCLHNVTKYEWVDNDYYDAGGFEEFCADCGAWFNDLDNKWEKQ